MDALKDILICRLCGVNITEGKYKSIFKGSTDLINKIKETLPISISIDDNGSKYICLPCYNKITLYYKFVQEVVEYSKRFENTSQMKSLFNLTEEVSNFSQIHSDAVYTCPNCNIDLMILLISNPQGCDYTFQISLAMVNHSTKKHITKEKNIQIHKSIVPFNNSKINAHLGHGHKIITTESIEVMSNAVSPMLPVLKQEENLNCIEALSGEQNSETEIQEKFRKQLKKSNSCEASIDSIELQNAMLKNHGVQDENDTYKFCLKYECKLCGARYLSYLKYEFHMERHKAGKIHKYECIVCDKETSSENLLWDHYYYTHISLQRYICVECGKIFTKQSRLNGHQKNYKHSGVKQIQVDTNMDTISDDIIQNVVATMKQDKISVNCNLCGKLISDLDPSAINDLVTCASCEDSTLSLMVDGNETKVISPRQYHCSQCPKHFVRKERLEFHEMRHNENMNEIICSTCGKDFRAENSLYEHYLFVHKGARPHICELCGKSFQLKARLKEHHRIHTGERPYQCDICGQRCRTTNALKLHRKIHFSHNRYTCNVCNKSFSKKQNMNEHLEKHWKNDKSVMLPQLFTCPICVEDFPTYRMLKYHMIDIHEINSQDPILTKQKPWYECVECHEKFKHQMSLKAHKERVHEGKVDPIYQCDVCKATYRVKQLLVNHIKSKHNGERRYKCAQCEKGFNDTKSLYNHVLLHTGKKPFICEYCNMSFRRKDSRDHHRRKHTGEQPYQCPDCGESFSTYNNRSKHRKREHGEGDPECPECGQKCSNQQEIRIHLNKHLGEKLKKLRNIKCEEI
ncbi:uncharacterized protein LOC143423071 [Xylocopa sonorina]|uniref:uncharacterized protein LOC143423071 n=1 Tax=Xylocopa sonorina TaxID=1818115 RepID=UPI00403B0734